VVLRRDHDPPDLAADGCALHPAFAPAATLRPAGGIRWLESICKL